MAAAPILPVALGAMAAGTALQTIGQIQTSRSAIQAAEANAQISRQQAAAERARSQIDVELARRRARREQGARITAIGASGITLSGSALDVLADAALSDAQEVALIRFEGEERARARLQQAAIFEREAKAERRALPIRAGATILTGASQVGLLASRSPSIRRGVSTRGFD